MVLYGRFDCRDIFAAPSLPNHFSIISFLTSLDKALPCLLNALISVFSLVLQYFSSELQYLIQQLANLAEQVARNIPNLVM